MFERMRALRSFKGFADADLARLAAQVGERRMAAGDVLFREGEEGHACYVVLDGELEVLGHLGPIEIRLHICRSGQIIGEMALLNPGPRSATVRALTESHLAVLDAEAFLTLMRGNPEWTFDLLRSTAARLRSTDQQMIDELEAKNAELLRAYHALQRAQAERIRLSRIDEELAIARRIQKMFMPRTLPQPAGWQVAAFNRGAQAVGGDFFDCIELPDGHLGFVIADVCGKGVPAALFVALTRSLVRAASQAPGVFQRADLDLDELLASTLWFTNDYIASEHGESHMFITLFYGVLDPKTGVLIYVNAGHNPPLVVGADGARVRELESAALPLGILAGQMFRTSRVTLAPGELLASFSDGITEAIGAAGEPYGDARLLAALRAQSRAPAPAIVAAIVDDVDAYVAGAPQADDMTLLLIRRTG